jgi:hypothetical protein
MCRTAPEGNAIRRPLFCRWLANQGRPIANFESRKTGAESSPDPDAEVVREMALTTG